jgi:hypothetical protein
MPSGNSIIIIPFCPIDRTTGKEYALIRLIKLSVFLIRVMRTEVVVWTREIVPRPLKPRAYRPSGSKTLSL